MRERMLARTQDVPTAPCFWRGRHMNQVPFTVIRGSGHYELQKYKVTDKKPAPSRGFVVVLNMGASLGT